MKFFKRKSKTRKFFSQFSKEMNITACVYAPPPDIPRNTYSDAESPSAPEKATDGDDHSFVSESNISACVYAPPPDISEKDESDTASQPKRKIAPVVYDGYDPRLDIPVCVYAPPPDIQDTEKPESKGGFVRKWLKK